jgi:N-carbamoylputrescine amidase
VRVALLPATNWREAVPEARERGAELICLPHLSFSPYVAAARDRDGLEHAERPVSRSFRDAGRLAGDAWLAASAYESKGEGVFYVTARLARGGAVAAAYRQRHVEAAPGRYEQMFWSPGHEPFAVAELPWGRTGLLVGFDLRTPAAWAELAAAGARVVLGGASEPAELWAATRRVAAGMAAAYGMTVLIANRSGSAAFDPSGAETAPGDDSLFAL